MELEAKRDLNLGVTPTVSKHFVDSNIMYRIWGSQLPQHVRIK